MTITVTPAGPATELDVHGYALDDLSNVACSAFRERVDTCGGGGGGSNSGYVDLSLYFDPDDALTDAQLALYPDTSTWVDISADFRRATVAARTAGLKLYHGGVKGRYFLDIQDTSTPVIIWKGSGFEGPDVARIQLSYFTDGGGVLRDSVPNQGLVFVVDTQSPRRNIPKIALQGSTVTRKLQIAGVGIIAQRNALNVTAYPTITGSLLDHAPVICTDHRHNPDGTSATSAKAGNVTLEAHLVGLMQGAYIGDPLFNTDVSDPDHALKNEESWATLTASNLQTGISFTNITLTGCCLKRMLGTARSTAGGLTVNIQNIPPYWTGISQPNSAGPDYKLLKWQQQNCRVLDMWHRAVGFDITIQARSARYGVYMQAGYNALGPAKQDTGKYNAGTIRLGCERVISYAYIAPNAYGHRLNFVVGGHSMDEYNLKGETGATFDIQTDGTVAGAIDKAVYDNYLGGTDYGIDDKVNAGSGSVWSATVAGTGTSPPIQSGPNYDATAKTFQDPGSSLKWIFRNGGFKPVGAQPFAVITYSGTLQESAGPTFRGNTADGHLEHDASGLNISNWSQAKTHHADAAFYNPSSTTVLVHLNARTNASGNSKRVYDVANPQNLVVGNNRHYGQAIPVDGAGAPTGVFPTAIGGNLLDSFWAGKNCLALSAGASTGDDDGDESDG